MKPIKQLVTRKPFFVTSLDVEVKANSFETYAAAQSWLSSNRRFVPAFQTKLKTLIGSSTQVEDIAGFTHLALCLPCQYSVSTANGFPASLVQQMLVYLYAEEQRHFKGLRLKYTLKDYIHFLLHQPSTTVRVFFAEQPSEQLSDFCGRLLSEWSDSPTTYMMGDGIGGLLALLSSHDHDHLFSLFTAIFLSRKRDPELTRKVLSKLILAIPPREMQTSLDLFRMRTNTMPRSFLETILGTYAPDEIAIIIQDYIALASRRAFQDITEDNDFSPIRWLFTRLPKRRLTWEKERSILVELHLQGFVTNFRTLYFWAGSRARRRDFLLHILEVTVDRPLVARANCIAEAFQTEWLIRNESLFTNADLIFAVAEKSSPELMAQAFSAHWHHFYHLEDNATYLSEFILKHFVVRKLNKKSKHLSEIQKKHSEFRARLSGSEDAYIEKSCRDHARLALTSWYSDWLFRHPDTPAEVIIKSLRSAKRPV